MEKPFIPPEFREKYSSLLGKESAEFFECCSRKIPKSIWINSLFAKPGLIAKDIRKKNWILEPLFHENAFALVGVEKPGQSPEFRKGLFNLQEKASMLPAIILDPGKRDFVLDAAAAPGNKTLQLSCLMNGAGRIIAVEKNVERFRSLRFNVKKFGVKNVLAKRMDLLDARRKNVFDKILLDAPCSSEGLVRKDPDALANWSTGLVMKKAVLQKAMIGKAFDLLKQGGALVYSTCSFAPEENEGVVQTLLENGGRLEKIGVKGFRLRNGLAEYNGKRFDESMALCARVYPQDNDTQQFFIAKIRKTRA